MIGIQGLSTRAAGLFGYGVMMTSDYMPELSAHEREKQYRIREKERLKKLNAPKKGTEEIEGKALILLNAMPNIFTVFDLRKKNEELKIFQSKNCSYLPKYFKQHVTTKTQRVNGTRVAIYTKVAK